MSDHDKCVEQLIDELNEVRIEVVELKAAQKLLSEKESLYRDIVDKAGEAIFVIQDGRIKYVNQIATELTGYSRAEGLVSQAIEALYTRITGTWSTNIIFADFRAITPPFGMTSDFCVGMGP